MKRAGLRPAARAGGRLGQPGGGSWPRRPGSDSRPPTARGAASSRGWGGAELGWGGPPGAGDTGLQHGYSET